uniref:Methyltransferase FkbM domain-containing protein n=1 Tax=Eutreptiella gymnastica TaxID=73025 RepID=A0A7S4GM60_9EUGL|mmetsp:Transcript_51209/g.84303  ORF Transcript_51209/g.84303 Transcript_51209/m.84303 type:complete len:347 (+) Transcript_51209:150-1190(+)
MRTGSLEDAFRSLEADVSTVVRELGELKDKHTVLSATVQDWKEAASLPKGNVLSAVPGSSGPGAVPASQCQTMQEQYYRQNKETFHGDDAKALFLRVVGKYFPTPCGRSGETTAVIDVGANTGQDVKYFSKWFGAGQSCRSKIYLFEPNPQVVKYSLQPRAAKYAETEIIQGAVSNFTGEQQFYTNVDASSKKNEQGSLGKIHWMKGGTSFPVPTYTLDNFVDEKGIAYIPFLKVDAEGWEGAVFQGGGRKALKMTDFVFFECSDTLDDSRGTGHKLKDIVGYLDAAGFEVYKIGTRYMLKMNGPYWHDVYDRIRYWSNCMAVSSTLQQHLRPRWLDGRNRSMVLC